MEPVTHVLTGACLSRTGLNRYAAYATLTMMVAAEFPDIDMLWGLRGPVEQLQHHRGITHSFLGLPFEAALIVAGVYGWHQWRVRRARRGPGLKSPGGGEDFRGSKPPAPSGEQAMATSTAGVSCTPTSNKGSQETSSASRGTTDAFRSGPGEGDWMGVEDPEQTAVRGPMERGFPAGMTTEGSGSSVGMTAKDSGFPAGMTERRTEARAGMTAKDSGFPAGMTERRTEARAGMTTEGSGFPAGMTERRTEARAGMTTEGSGFPAGMTERRTEARAGMTTEGSGFPAGMTERRTEATAGVIEKKAEATAGMTERKTKATAVETVEQTATGGRVVKPLTAAPVRWGVLYGLALLALLSHLLLDYTNSYGLRPFFPFNDRWYAASIMFLFDPVMFALLLGAVTAPWLFGLVGSEVGAKKQPFPARGWAIAALIGVVGWWGLREVEHGQAMKMAMAQSMAAPVESGGLTTGSEDPSAGGADASPNTGAAVAGVAPEQAIPVYLQTQRALASPEMLSPFQWSAVMDFGPVYQMGAVDTRQGTLTMGQTTYPKPVRSPAVLEAEESKLGRVYMDWSPMPIVEVLQPDSALAGVAGEGTVDRVVTFRDPRFMGGGRNDAARPPLEGMVALDAGGRVAGERLGGRVER